MSSRKNLLLNLKQSYTLRDISLNLNSLIDAYKATQDTKDFNRHSVVCLMLCYILSEQFNEIKKKKEYFRKFFNQSSAEFSTLLKIVQIFLDNPFSNISSQVKSFFKSSSEEVAELAAVFLQIYEYKQAVYLGSIYKNVSLKNLSKNFVSYTNDDLKSYLDRYGFTLQGEFVVLRSIEKEEKERLDFCKELNFLNATSVQLENVVRVNPSLHSSLANENS